MMKLPKIFKKKYSTTKVKYWTFKKIPLENWQLCQDGEILNVRQSFNEDDIITENDILTWEAMQDLYIDEFQEDKHKVNVTVRLQITLANLKLEYIRDSKANRILINEINQIEEELRKQRDIASSNGMTMEECKIAISKYQGYHLPETITAYSFFTMIKTINKQAKENG